MCGLYVCMCVCVLRVCVKHVCVCVCVCVCVRALTHVAHASSQVFNCPGSSHFIVEFDPRCETEKRYDYLEFTDSNGLKVKFEQKVMRSRSKSQGQS